MSRHRLFLLSPARCDGERAKLLFRPEARFELAMKLRTPQGAALGEVFSFLSGLYFRGKLAYSRRFANPPAGIEGQLVITSNRGLVPADAEVTLADLRRMGTTAIDVEDRRYRTPLVRSLKQLRERAADCEIVLLGSVASGKYAEILIDVLGPRILFPGDFVGRGDMSRGGLMLRCVDAGSELTYLPIDGSARRGSRPPKLARRMPVSSPTLDSKLA
jgi:hypothetical protein